VVAGRIQRTAHRFDAAEGTISSVVTEQAITTDEIGRSLDGVTQRAELIAEGVVQVGAVPAMPPGSVKGLQLVVPDIHQARAELAEHGVPVSEVQVVGENPRPVPQPLDNVGFVFFADPDGNGWAVQQISSRA
jgi:catechol 2,3-dioxygenase-like lactoylglutathione lyase family enzyme